jgi:hypothetical protein
MLTIEAASSMQRGLWVDACDSFVFLFFLLCQLLYGEYLNSPDGQTHQMMYSNEYDEREQELPF